MEDIRIINDKTGKVNWVSPLVAKDTKTLAYYGFRVEHLNKNQDSGNNNSPDLREKYKAIFGRYPAGKMKSETIAKAIQEAETKQLL